MDAEASELKDLASRADIHDLVVNFYREIVFDDLLGPVFSEVAEVDWSAHIPKLIDYWCRVLFGDPSYPGGILGPHAEINDLEPFTKEMFDRWYGLWVTEVDGLAIGPNATKAKSHAAKMSNVLSKRLTSHGWSSPQVDEDFGGESACLAHIIESETAY